MGRPFHVPPGTFLLEALTVALACGVLVSAIHAAGLALPAAQADACLEKLDRHLISVVDIVEHCFYHCIDEHELISDKLYDYHCNIISYVIC